MKLSRDINGNKIVQIQKSDLGGAGRGFSIQTNGNLPITHSDGICDETYTEIYDYIRQHGSDRQKALIGADKEISMRNIIDKYATRSKLFKHHLTDSDIDQLLAIFGERCIIPTKARIKSLLTYDFRGLDYWGCADRIMYDPNKDRWFYVAGQDYTNEIKEIRKAMIK